MSLIMGIYIGRRITDGNLSFLFAFRAIGVIAYIMWVWLVL